MSRRDPTRSAGLRRQGRGLVARKVFELHRQLRQTLQDNDLPGLRQREIMPNDFLGFVEASGNRLERSEMMLSRIVELALLHPPDWLRTVIERAVWKGVEQVGQELRTEIQHLDAYDVTYFHSTAAAIEVRGIAGETERRVLRNVGDALEAQRTPEELMRAVRRVLEKITRFRLNLLVNTAVVRAVNGGKLFAYGANGINRFGIEPEWLPGITRLHDHLVPDVRDRKQSREARSASTIRRRVRAERKLEAAFKASEVNILTAGDDKVCEDCLNIAANGPYDLDAARGLIPQHPNCRCAFIPAGDLRFAPIVEQEEE